MDPNAVLDMIRVMLKDLESMENIHINDVCELFEAVAALDDWLTRGGFLPSEWNQQWRGSDVR